MPEERQILESEGSGIAKYAQLAAIFRRKIVSGAWAVGAQIPTVLELAEAHGVAAATIRKALDWLEDEQLIERHRAKGTFVRSRPADALWLAIQTNWAGLLRPAQDARIEILSDESNVSGHVFEWMLGRPSKAYRRVRRRHWRNEQAFLLAEVSIDERLRNAITLEDLETKTALRLVSDLPGVKIADARQTITIGIADADTTAKLALPPHSPVALVHRRAVDEDGVLVLAADGIYRGDVVRFEVGLR